MAIHDLGDLDACFPKEICDMILGYLLPSGCIYRFRGRLRIDHVDGVPPLDPFLVNRQMRKDAMRIWLKQNFFSLIANTLPSYDFERVEPMVPREDNIESCIDWIERMAEFTQFINSVVICRPLVGELFPQFFELVKLLRKHDLFITVRGRRPEHNITMGTTGPQQSGLNIYLVQHVSSHPNPRDERLCNLHLRMLDLGHEARAAGTSLVQLKTQFNNLLVERGYSLISQPTVLLKSHRFAKRSDMSAAKIPKFYHGGKNLLYPSRQAAEAAVLAVNEGEKPSTETLYPSWVTFLIIQLEEWCRELRQFRVLLEDCKRQGDVTGFYAPPSVALSYDHIFGRYGTFRPLNPSVNARNFDAHILFLDEELHRTNAHITAMEPYCRSHISLPLAFL